MRIRIWLERNKIFFETIAAVLLGIMAVILSVQSNNISTQTNKIINYQTEIMRTEHLPILHLEVELVYDTLKEFFANDKLVISNVGAPLSEFSCRNVEFFEANYGKLGDMKIASIPLNAYYGVTMITNKPTGVLATLVNLHTSGGNNRKAFETSRSFARFAEQRDAYGFADIRRYVKVSFKDVFGETHDEFYLANSFGANKLSDAVGMKIFEDYESKFENSLFIEFSKVTPELLYAKWLMITQEFDKKQRK